MTQTRDPITTHILDTSRGKPAAGVPVILEKLGLDHSWKKVGEAVTNADGRVERLLHVGTAFNEGMYRFTFETAEYFRALGTETFYPRVEVLFEVKDAKAHYHVPLLLNPFGYSTYRGT